MVHHGFAEIPTGLILKRWTREAKFAGDPELAAVVAEQRVVELDFAGMHTLVYSAAMELVGLAATSRPAFEIGIQALSRAKQAILAVTVVAEPRTDPLGPVLVDAYDGNVDALSSVQELAGASAPPRVRSRGRPAKTRLKSPIESPGACKRKTKNKVGNADESTLGTRQSKRIKNLAEGNVSNGKCRICGSSDHYASACPRNNLESSKVPGVRKCKACGGEGHYRSTCGRVSTYGRVKHSC